MAQIFVGVDDEYLSNNICLVFIFSLGVAGVSVQFSILAYLYLCRSPICIFEEYFCSTEKQVFKGLQKGQTHQSQENTQSRVPGSLSPAIYEKHENIVLLYNYKELTKSIAFKYQMYYQ